MSLTSKIAEARARKAQLRLDVLMAAAVARHHQTPAWQLELAARKAQAVRA
jgi:hypothetical protein